MSEGECEELAWRATILRVENRWGRCCSEREARRSFDNLLEVRFARAAEEDDELFLRRALLWIEHFCDHRDGLPDDPSRIGIDIEIMKREDDRKQRLREWVLNLKLPVAVEAQRKLKSRF